MKKLLVDYRKPKKQFYIRINLFNVLDLFSNDTIVVDFIFRDFHVSQYKDKNLLAM